MSEQIAGAFDTPPKETAPPTETVGGHSGTVNLDAAPTPDAKAWERSYNGHADLRDFARAKDGDPLSWEYDHEKIGKTMRDRLSHIGKLEATIASLRGSGDDKLTVAKSLEDYLEGFDHEGLKAKAARAYLGRPEQGQNPAEAAFFQAMYDQGVPVEKAREAFTSYMTAINEHIPVPKTDQERLGAAVKALGANGRQQLAEVNEWLASEHARDPFSKETQKVLGALQRSPEGLAFLWRQSRVTAQGAPPTHNGKGEVLTQDEIREAMVSERYRRDSEYRNRILAASKRSREKDGATSDGWSGTISL